MNATNENGEDHSTSDLAAVTSNEVNMLVWAYLQETGLDHSAFSLLHESRLSSAVTASDASGTRIIDVPLPQNHLVRILHKGLLYLEAEARWRGEDTKSNPPKLLGYAVEDRIPLPNLRQSPPEPPTPKASTSQPTPLLGPRKQRSQSNPPAPTSVKPSTSSKDANPSRTLSQSVNITQQPASIPEEEPIHPLPNLLPATQSGSGQSEPSSRRASLSPEQSRSATLPPLPQSNPQRQQQQQQSSAKRKEREHDLDSHLGPPPSHKASTSSAGDMDVDKPESTASSPKVTRRKSFSAEPPVSRKSSGQQSAMEVDEPEQKRPKIEDAPVSSSANSAKPANGKHPDSIAMPAPPTPSSVFQTPALPSSSQAASAPLPSPALPRPNPSVSLVSVRTVSTPKPAQPQPSPSANNLQANGSHQRSTSPNVSRSNSLNRSANSASSSRRGSSPEVTRNHKPKQNNTAARVRTVSAKPILQQARTNSETNTNGKQEEEAAEVPKPRGKDPTLGEAKPDKITLLQGHSSSVQPCCWNPKVPHMLATASIDSTARIWDVSTEPGTKISDSVICKHSSGSKKSDIPVVAWNPDGTLLATGAEDGIARIWTLAGDLYLVLSMHQRGIYSIRWNSKGTMLLTGSLDNTCCLWELNSGKVKQQWETHSDSVLDCDWYDDSTFASCSMDKTVHILALNRPSPLHRLRGHKDEINSCRFDPSKTMLATSSDDKTVRIWSMTNLLTKPEEGEEQLEIDKNGGVFLLQGHTDQVQQVVWQNHPNAKRRLLASTSFDTTARLWDADKGTCLYTFVRNTAVVYSVSFSPLGSEFLVTGSDDNRMCIYRVSTGELVYEFVHNGGVYEALWHPTRNQIAVTGADPSVAVVDVSLLDQ